MIKRIILALLLTFLEPVAAQAALAVVQTQNGSASSGTGSMTLGSSPTTGNLEIAWISSANNGSGDIIGVLNTGAGLAGWHVITTNYGAYNNFNVIVMLYRYVQSGDTTALPALLTSSKQFLAYEVAEISGVNGNLTNDLEAYNFDHDLTTATVTTKSYSTLNAGDLVLLGAFSNTSPAMTGFSGWTAPVNANNGSTYGSWVLAWEAPASGTNISTVFTPGGTSRPTGYIALVLSGTATGSPNMNDSKMNSYPVMIAGTDSAMSNSKIDSYPLLNAGTDSAMSVSKMNAYIVLYGIPQHTTPLFHSFPP